MKNRLYWLLILSIFIFVWFIYLISREESNKNLVTKTWAVLKDEKKIIFRKADFENKKISWTWKIEELREKNINYAYFNINSEKFYFNIVDSKLEISFWEKKIWVFDVVLKEDIKVSEIFWDKNIFLIELWEKKYIYSKKYSFIKEFQTKLDIEYSKISISDFIFFSKDKWSFVLYKEKNDLEYFSLFTDFIFHKDYYIWIIASFDEDKKKRFSLNWNKNYILSYNPITKEKKIIYELDFLPKKIWQEDEKIFIENFNQEKFIIENY